MSIVTNKSKNCLSFHARVSTENALVFYGLTCFTMKLSQNEFYEIYCCLQSSLSESEPKLRHCAQFKKGFCSLLGHQEVKHYTYRWHISLDSHLSIKNMNICILYLLWSTTSSNLYFPFSWERTIVQHCQWSPSIAFSASMCY